MKDKLILGVIGFVVIVGGMLTWSWATTKMAAAKAKKAATAPK
jgi:flagellar basal body-associated protein FliL